MTLVESSPFQNTLKELAEKQNATSPDFVRAILQFKYDQTRETSEHPLLESLVKKAHALTTKVGLNLGLDRFLVPADIQGFATLIINPYQKSITEVRIFSTPEEALRDSAQSNYSISISRPNSARCYPFNADGTPLVANP